MSKTLKNLNSNIEKLNEKGQKSLLEFAEFLATKEANLDTVIEYGEPEFYTGPKGESVIKALKRLQKIYQMINTKDIFTSASRLMTEHMMQGRDAQEVIAEMETLFKDHYKKMKND